MRLAVVCALWAGVVVALAVDTGRARNDAPEGSASASAVAPRACRLGLPPFRAGEPRFAVPAGGRLIARALPDRIVLCTLLRADRSKFGDAKVDRRQQVLEMRFFRPSGRLLVAVDAAYPAFPREQGAQVSCGSPASSSLGNRYWQRTIRWWLGKTPTNLPRAPVVLALRAAQAEWTNNVNWCHYPDSANGLALYEGRTSSPFAHDGRSTVEWGRLHDQSCKGAIGCTTTWYDADGNPVESDVCFSSAVRWSVRPDPRGFDVQSVAAHEFGHVRQFDHVTSERLKEYTLVMWPYFTAGNTSGRELGRGDALANNSHY